MKLRTPSRNALRPIALLWLTGVFSTLGLGADEAAPPGLWSHENLVAWCVVPFDAKHRGPEERAEMLERLGFKHFAYDWREKDVPTFDAELDALDKHHIDLAGWWFPMSAADPKTKATLDTFKRHHVHPQLWLTEGGAPTKTPQEQKARVDQTADRVAALEKVAAPYGCKVELYSHNNWFGMEENEVAVIQRLKELGVTDVGMVYNFSHAHDAQHDDTTHFPEIWKMIQPYVVAVNLTGMGPPEQNIYLTQGQHELDMMRTIQDSGWHGLVGLIAEKGGDAEITLASHMKGLDWLAAELRQPGSGGPPPFPQVIEPTKSPQVPSPPPAAANLPEYQVIPAATRAELTPANGWPGKDTFKTWTRSHGGPASTRYSGWAQINKQNVSRLTVAWTYHSGDGGANIQCNPIIVNGVIFLPTADNHLAAVDGATGKEIWRYTPELQGNGLEDVPARRGLIYWAGDGAAPPRILFTMGTWLYALDPKTGKPIDGFGEQGRARLPRGGCSVAPAIYKNVVVLPGFWTGVYAYDVRTGAPLWTFHTLPTGNEPGAETWGGTEREGANDWGGMAMDESRGIAYVATGSPKPNFIGYTHTGDNLYGNCVIALDALTGRRLWHFQEIRHDVWDLDLPAPPILVTVTHDGMKVDAVAAVSKIGNTLLLDRVTGKPLFPFRLRRAPPFKLPGDIGSPYQPDVELPQPFARQEFTVNDVTNLNPAAHDAVMKKVEAANLGWFVPFEDGKPSIYFGIHGGAEWTGAAADPRGRMYVTSTELPWIEEVYHLNAKPQAELTPQAAAGHTVYQANCVACHGPELKGLGVVPSLVGLGNRMDEKGFRAILRIGRNAMRPQPQLSQEQITQLCAFLLDKSPRPAAVSDGAAAAVQWADMGYARLLDPQNYPGCTPPWGTLNCIDLNTGKIAWKVPLGEYPELKARGIPKTGTENFGGATATAGGVVFAGGTRDNQIRAFDADTGEELWKHDLPLHETAPPAVYEVHDREYVVLPATGGGKLGGPVGDAWVAFALPND